MFGLTRKTGRWFLVVVLTTGNAGEVRKVYARSVSDARKLALAQGGVKKVLKVDYAS